MQGLIQINEFLQYSPLGFHIPECGIYIDPQRPVEKALVTHAHADHCRRGSKKYLCSNSSRGLVELRGGPNIQTLAFGETLRIGEISLSLHPAGHILGSSQVLIEKKGEKVLITGDYKHQSDLSAESYENVQADTLISESTFSLPIYNWRPTEEVISEILAWWNANSSLNTTSILYAYSLGKSQRILSSLLDSPGPIGAHGSVLPFLPIYKSCKVKFPEVVHANATNAKTLKGKGLVIAPLSAMNSPWLKHFRPFTEGIASGWMNTRGSRKRRGVEKGFVLSDHVDWKGILDTVRNSKARKVFFVHGDGSNLKKYILEQKEFSSIEVEALGQGREEEVEA